jgi:hypothetical protein
MNRQLFALSVSLLTLGATALPLLAQELPSRDAIQLRVEAQQRRANETAQNRAGIDVNAEAAAFAATANSFRYETSAQPSPLFTNPGDAQGILLPANAVYGQSQSGAFGQPTAQWLSLGKSPFPAAITSPYGLRLNWDSALAVFNLVDKGIAGQKDLVIGFGGSTGDILRFNFFPTVTSSTATTVVSFFPTGVIRNINGVRSGSETGTSQLPTVNTAAGYVGVINRRINDTSLGLAGRVLARTDTLTLERDGTTAGLRINNPTGVANQTVACLGITSTGGLATRVFSPLAGLTTVFSDLQGVISVDCTFGNAFNLANITKVHLLRFPNDFFWVGTVTSTFNQ